MKFQLFAGAFALSVGFVTFVSLPAPAAPLLVGKPAPSQAVTLLVKLPLRNQADLENLTRLQSDPRSPMYHKFLSVAQFRANYGPLPATVQQAALALRASGLQVTKSQAQMLQVSGPVLAVQRAFGINLGITRGTNGKLQLAADAAPSVPKALAALNASVIGLGYHVGPRPQSRHVGPVPENRSSPVGGYWFDDLKQAYSYPSYTPFNGKGVTIATVGESDFSDSDAKKFFNHELLGGPNALAPQPTLERLDLGGLPFDPSTSISAEANIDVQFAGGSAPGATILGINVPSIGEGFLYAYSVIDEYNLADIVSTSYGECELYYTAAYNSGIDQTSILHAYHDLFLQGNAQGITFLFSSGDNSGVPCYPPGYFGPPTGAVFKTLPGTSIWADDPNATAVGGTNLVTSYTKGKLTSTYVSENEIADTVNVPFDDYGTGNYLTGVLWGSGGGASTIFAKPWYQNLVTTGSTMRKDPDISMQMGGCPGYTSPTGARVPLTCGVDSYGIAYVGGSAGGWIGTSLSSPEFAGLLAVLEQSQGGVRFGNVNGYIYTLAQTNSVLGHTVFHQGIPASNGVVSFPSGRLGWNSIVGVGTPIANNFLLLPYSPLAGDPQTASNP